MSPIKVLEPLVVSRIAAGEVVERPASVVKELIENSLDAGASQITVEARGGGLALIRVIDNGCGIPAGEVDLAFQRHATSKIAGLEDLDSILTLGFRGEALPSIAAVSEVDIVTCAGSGAAAEHLTLKDGVVTGRDSQARTRGTSVEVRHLFRSVPARLKFVKSVATENSHIATVITQYALARPGVKFVLASEGRISLRTPGSGKLPDAFAGIYGAELAAKMLPLDDEPGWQAEPPIVRVSGITGTPEASRSSRDLLCLSVNRRWVSSRLLAWALEEAYHGLLMTGRHPVAVIDIALPPGEVDVNIHPAKSEVRFRNERAVITALQRAVRHALLRRAPVRGIEEPAALYQPRPPAPASSRFPFEKGAAPEPAVPLLPKAALPALRVLGQLMQTYVVAEGPDGLYLVDQHAAHERVLFERILKSGEDIERQGLLEPVTLQLSPRQAAAVEAAQPALASLGFDISPFGEGTWLVRSVPAMLNGKDWSGALTEALDSGEDGWRERLAMSFACHGAVRAGQSLSDAEMRGLLRDLEQASLPHTCPHGRPTMLHLAPGRLEREFGRSG